MFSLLIAYDPTAWETDQVMRMDADRFKEYTDGAEAQAVSLEKTEDPQAPGRSPRPPHV